MARRMPAQMTDTDKAKESASELRKQIKALERSLQEEVCTRTALEFELYQIKNSLAWTLLVSYRHVRDNLLAEGSRRLVFYEILRDLVKTAVLFRGQSERFRLSRLPALTAKAFRIMQTEGLSGLRRELRSELDLNQEYSDWVKQYDTLTDTTRKAIRHHSESLNYRPCISIIMPVYNTPGEWLRRAIDSVRAQLYTNWELCIADDASPEISVRQILEEYRSKDSRIKVVFRKSRGHISAASNSAIDIAIGEFIAFLDHDDELSEHALYWVGVELNKHAAADLIYSDEDKIDEAGHRYDPYFKPDWNPALFHTQNYICHLSVYRSAVVKELGALRPDFDGAQDWDLALRVIERIPPLHIRHIPHVLYHWRAAMGSTAITEGEKNYVKKAQLKTLQSHFDRIDRKAEIVPAADQYWRAKYLIAQPLPRVTLIIPTRNGVELLRACVESIHAKTTYGNYELLIVDNQSDDPETLSYLQRLEGEGRARILRYDAAFNYAAINNYAVRSSQGDLIGLLNNDLEVITPEWLEEMVSYAVQPDIGAVGAMLYYPDGTIQHAGVILGIGFPPPGVAGHVYKHCPRHYRGQSSRALLCQNMSAVTGACMVVRREAYQDVGGLDEMNLPIAFNDIDFCLRLLKKGYRNVWTPHAELYHRESASRGYEVSPDKLDRFDRETQYMKQQWQEVLVHDPAYNPNLALGREPFMLSFPPRLVRPWIGISQTLPGSSA